MDKHSTRVPQSGSVLLVVIVLLLLASLISLFAVKVGVFNQRTSGNEVRAKLLQGVAEAALAQGAELIAANEELFSDESLTSWELCAADDDSFPCGAMPSARRATMYRYVGGGSGAAVFGDADVDSRLLPLQADQLIADVGNGQGVVYGVGAVMCRVDPDSSGAAAECSTDQSEGVFVYAPSLVAVATMPGESARATAVKSFAVNPRIGLGVGTPPLVASGNVTLRGGLQVVAAPNAGSDPNSPTAASGNPVSIWTRVGVDSGGTPNTCSREDFYATDDQADGITCPGCSCSSATSTDDYTKGHGNSCTGGNDIVAPSVDCAGWDGPPMQEDEFPCDLFQQVFGVKVRMDDPNGDGMEEWDGDTDGDGDDDSARDNFCETLITVPDPECDSGVCPEIGADEAFLAETSDWIINANDAFGARFAGDARLTTCAGLAGKSGVVWNRSGSACEGMTIGTVDDPVILVHDGSGSFQNLVLYGVLFLRSTGAAPLDAATGGNAEFRLNAGSQIYGSAIIQGPGDKANGHAALVSAPKIMEDINDRLSESTVYGLPASWSDRVSY